MEKTKEDQLINSMNADQESIKILGEYLGYESGKNPVDPESDIRIYFTNKTEDKNSGVMAVVPVEDLTDESNTIFIRKL